MSTSDTAPQPAPSRRRARKEAKKSLWQMDLSSIGKKGAGDTEERLERPPFEPTLPQVNLLPASVTESISVRRILRRAVAALVVLLLAVGAVWWLQGSTIERAEQDLAAAEAENARLQAELQSLAPVRQMYEQITRLQDLVTTTLAAQPEAAVVLRALAEAGAEAGGDDITFAGAEVDYVGIPAPGGVLNPCANPDPFGVEPVIGCLSFTATAGTRAQVSELLRVLEADPLFVGPYSTSSTVTEIEGGADSVSFAGTAGISLEGLATLLTPEQIDAIVNPPAPQDEDAGTATDEQGAS